MKITAEIYKGDPALLKCSLSQRTFEQKAGLRYTHEGNPVSPEAAHAAGVDLSGIRPPESVNSKVTLSDFMTKDLGLRRNSNQYLKYYSTWAPLYPFQTT